MVCAQFVECLSVSGCVGVPILVAGARACVCVCVCVFMCVCKCGCYVCCMTAVV